MALRLMLEFGARRPTNVGQIFFFFFLTLSLLLSVSVKRKLLAGHWPGFLFLSASQVAGEKKETGRRSVVFLDFSVRRRKVVGF